MKIKEKIDKQKLMLVSFLITSGILGRILLHDFFNSINNPFSDYGFLDVFFVIAVVSIYSGILLGKYYAFIVPLCIIAITDIFYVLIDPQNAALWTSWLFLFTGSGYVFIALIGFYSKRKLQFKLTYIPNFLGAGIIGVLTYDLWTNFGFWLSYSKLGFYPPTLDGLITVYIGGIPFMLWHLLSTTLTMTIIALPLLYYKEYELPIGDNVLKTVEKFIIASATIILIVVSITTALI
jgi:hypothetical protein